MGVWTNALLITLICVMVVDVSGFIGDMEGALGKWLGCRVRIPKPFSCSFCMSFWANLFYSIFCGHLTIGFLAYALSLSVLTPVMASAVWGVRDFLGLAVENALRFLSVIITFISNFFRYG